MTALQSFEMFSTTATPFSHLIAQERPFRAAETSELSGTGEPAWVQSVAEQFVKLYSLRRGWDGYGAGPIRRDVWSFATEVLARIMEPDTPSPHIIPMSHEGVQIEWHQNGIELEIEIEAPGKIWVVYIADGSEKEWPMRSDFGSLKEPISNLTSRAKAMR